MRDRQTDRQTNATLHIRLGLLTLANYPQFLTVEDKPRSNKRGEYCVICYNV